MRLTGGDARGRPIRGPRGPGIRPTSDRVREALFDILGGRVREALFLDAFAGTGAVGIEALSRGARRVVFLEKDRAALRLIHENLGLFAWGGASEVLAGDVVPLLLRLARRRDRFCIVFLDPPYDHPDHTRLVEAASRVLDPDGILILEHRSSAEIKAPPGGGLRLLRTYRHGDSALTSFLPAARPA